MITLMPDPEKDSHDKAVQGLSREALEGIIADLWKTPISNRRDPVERWKLGRRAAAQRQLLILKSRKS